MPSALRSPPKKRRGDNAAENQSASSRHRLENRGSLYG
jgi:hypothetical protein